MTIIFLAICSCKEALFILDKTQKNLKCLSVSEFVDDMANPYHGKLLNHKTEWYADTHTMT